MNQLNGLGGVAGYTDRQTDAQTDIQSHLDYQSIDNKCYISNPLDTAAVKYAYMVVVYMQLRNQYV